MADKVDTRVSPAFDPATYMAVEGYDDATRGYVDDVVSVMNDFNVTLGKLGDARTAAEGNPGWTEAQRILIVGKEAAKQKDRLGRRLDRAVHDLDGRIAHVQADLARPVERGAAADPLAAEVRAHFKSVDRSERSKLIREALEADDEPTLQAVLGAQPFLSGMTAIDRDEYSARYHAKKNPHLVARLEVMQRVRAKLDVTGAHGPAFHLAFEKVVGAKPGVVAALDKADAAARAALDIQPTL